MAPLGQVLHPWATSVSVVAGPVPAPARLSPLLQSPEPPGEAAEGMCRSWRCSSSSALSQGRGISECRRANRLCSWGPQVSGGVGCVWRAGKLPAGGAALTSSTAGDRREQGLPAGGRAPAAACLCPTGAGCGQGCRGADAGGRLSSCSTAWGPVFAGAGSALAQGGRAGPSDWWLLTRSHLHVFSFVPRDSCDQRVCMHCPAVGSSERLGY